MFYDFAISLPILLGLYPTFPIQLIRNRETQSVVLQSATVIMGMWQANYSIHTLLTIGRQQSPGCDVADPLNGLCMAHLVCCYLSNYGSCITDYRFTDIHL